jgi:hypothetical protein
MKLLKLAGSAGEAGYEIRQLTFDLFHELSHPLTNLCCSLELTLVQSPTTEEYSQIVSRALVQAEKASELATAIRELLDAGNPGEKAYLFDLSHAVGDAVDDLLLVAESSGVEIAFVSPPPCPVWFDAQRLRQGLFHLFGSLIGMGVQGSVLKIELDAGGPQTLLGLNLSSVAESNGESDPRPDQKLLQRLDLGIARAIFEAAGGTFRRRRNPQNFTVNVLLSRTQPHPKQSHESKPS